MTEIVRTAVYKAVPPGGNFSGCYKPCSCESWLYYAHEISDRVEDITATYFNGLCECRDCGAVWWDSDWLRDGEPPV